MNMATSFPNSLGVLEKNTCWASRMGSTIVGGIVEHWWDQDVIQNDQPMD